MRATIRRAIAAHKAQRDENGQAGFSLIELIVVVVILGILAAVAIPIFLNLQQQARDSAAATIAANAATQAAAQMAQGATITAIEADLTKNFADTAGPATSVALTSPTTGDNIDQICVTVAYTGATGGSATAGPGCTP